MFFGIINNNCIVIFNNNQRAIKNGNFFEEIEEMKFLKQKNYAACLCFTVYRFKVKKRKEIYTRGMFTGKTKKRLPTVVTAYLNIRLIIFEYIRFYTNRKFKSQQACRATSVYDRQSDTRQPVIFQPSQCTP